MSELHTLHLDLDEPDLAKHVWFADGSGAAGNLYDGSIFND